MLKKIKKEKEKRREYFEAIDREKATENALLEAGAEHYDVVFLVHCALCLNEYFGKEKKRQSKINNKTKKCMWFIFCLKKINRK